MPTVEYLIVAAGAFAAGLALGPIIRQRSRRLMAIGGVVAALTAGALMWPPALSVLADTLGLDLLGVNVFGLDFVVAGLLGVAAVLLPLASGAAITGP